MNLATVLILVIPVLILLWGCFQCLRMAKHASELRESRMWHSGFWVLLCLAVILVSTMIMSQMDVPNPFAPTSDESSPASGFSRDFDDKLTVPTTNANPAKAAEDNRMLLEEAKSQQKN